MNGQEAAEQIHEAGAGARLVANGLGAEGRGERADSAAETLRAAGADVTLVEDAQAALEAMCARPPDIIVAEVRWPRGSGFSILAAARRSNPGAPAILFTGQPSVGEAVR